MGRRIGNIVVATIIGLFGVATGTGLTLLQLLPKGAPVAVEAVKQVEFEYTIIHKDDDGLPAEHTVIANAVDVKGNCIMFFRHFHVNAIVCPESMERIIVIDKAD